jgi:hypothetical protein
MDHNKLIAQKAKEHLKPIGFVRSGKSRVWYKDNGWWSVIIEFQPSSWSKGTYVNVSVSHLLYEQCGWTFNIPERLRGFASVEDDMDFEGKVEGMASQAANRAEELHNKYSVVENSIDWYAGSERRSIWDDYYSGILFSFNGDFEAAGNYFSAIVESEYSRIWEKAVQIRALELKHMLAFPDLYISTIKGIVLRTRNLMCLNDYKSDCLDIPWK